MKKPEAMPLSSIFAGGMERVKVALSLPTTDLAATATIRAVRAGLVVLPDKWTGPPEVRDARDQIDALAEQRAG